MQRAPESRVSAEIDHMAAWKAVLERDLSFDGHFVYAVTSTGVYCRPSCPSRRPKRENVQFFASPDQAERAAYRACLRCKPEKGEMNRAQQLVHEACRIIESVPENISLSELSRKLKVSPFHLQKTFKRITGVSPKQFASNRRVQRFKNELSTSRGVTEAIYQAGYGSGSRVYETSNAQLGMTPSAYKNGGRGIEIGFTIVKCRPGFLLVGATDRGICSVTLGDSPRSLEVSLSSEFPNAAIRKRNRELDRWVKPIVSFVDGQRKSLDLPLDIAATAFQLEVWNALQKIPYGETRSYKEVANAIGKPAAVRAVARACATNPVALLIPCHRVVASNGGLGGYKWGVERKKYLLGKESKKE